MKNLTKDPEKLKTAMINKILIAAINTEEGLTVSQYDALDDKLSKMSIIELNRELEKI